MELMESVYRVYAAPINEFLAGFISGSLGVMVSHPFDTIKVRLQTTSNISGPAMLRNTVSMEGPFALYNGMAGPLATASLLNAVCFSAYSSALRLLAHGGEAGSGEQQELFWQQYLAGTAGGLAQCFVATPVELVKCRLQIQGKLLHASEHIKYQNSWSCIKHILRTQGILGFYQGLGVTMIRDIPSYGLYFASYDSMKHHLTKKIGLNHFYSSVIGGGLAGSLAWAVVYPFDTVKTQIQLIDPTEAGKVKKRELKQTVWAALVRLHRNGGLSALYRGFLTTVIRAFPANAVILPSYEYTLSCLGSYYQEDFGSASLMN